MELLLHLPLGFPVGRLGDRRSRSGGRGRLPAPSSHRSVGARFMHTVPQVMGSLPDGTPNVACQPLVPDVLHFVPGP